MDISENAAARISLFPTERFPESSNPFTDKLFMADERKTEPTLSQPDHLSLEEFYSADAEELRIKYRQIEHLIGLSHHSSSEGSYCEVLLKEFLRRTLPRRVSVDSGFIRRVSDADWSQNSSTLPTDSAIASPQLDIIVHDTHSYAPLFRSEDFVVVLPEAVNAVIEVKKCLDRSKLTDALTNIATTTQLLRKWRHEPYRVFTCIFGFSLGKDLDPTTKVISNSFENCYQQTLDRFHGECELPYLLMALPRLSLQRSSIPNCFDYCPTAPDGRETPNIAGQFLLFLLSNYTSYGTQGRALVYPQAIKLRRKPAFTVQGEASSATDSNSVTDLTK